MTLILARNGLLVPYEELIKHLSMDGFRVLKKKYSKTTVIHNNIRKTISCVRKVKYLNTRYIEFPRMSLKSFCPKKFPVRKNLLQVGRDIEFESKITLTNNQVVVLNHLSMNVFTDECSELGTSAAIVNMAPGYGKTYLAIGVIERIKKKTLIIVPNSYLLRQWVGILRSNLTCKIGCFYGKEKSDGDIIVSIVNSAIKYPMDDVGFVIYDEIHMYCSRTRSQIFKHAQSLKVLGLSATTDERQDKFDVVSQWYCGDVIYASKLKGWNDKDVEFSTEVHKIMYYGSPLYTKMILSESGIVSVPLMINQMIEDPLRNKIIIEEALKLYRQDQFTFIFSDRRTHIEHLALILIEKGVMVEAPEIVTLMGGSSDLVINEAKKKGKIILTTYQYSGTGVSINKMDALILATPRKSGMKQILGRIFRLGGDASKKRRIVDLIDCNISLKNQYYERRKIYIMELNAFIKEKKIRYDR